LPAILLKSSKIQRNQGDFFGLIGGRIRHDGGTYGAIEYAYYLMAKAAGINMSECRLLEENERRHSSK